MSNSARANPQNLITNRAENHSIRCGRFDPVNRSFSEAALLASAGSGVNAFHQCCAVEAGLVRSQIFLPILTKNAAVTICWPEPFGLCQRRVSAGSGYLLGGA